MIFKRKRFMVVLCLLVSSTALFARAQQEVIEKVDTSVPPGEIRLLIADFEDSTMPMRVYNGSNSTIETDFEKKNVKQGNQSLKVTVDANDPTGIEIPVPGGRGDWSELLYLKMWVDGANTGNLVRVILEDSGNEQFMRVFYDIKEGWSQVSLEIADFISLPDLQEPGAVVNGEIDYPIQSLHFFSSNNCHATLYFDFIIATDDGQGIIAQEKAKREALLNMKPEPVPEGRYAIPAFKAMPAATAPEIDGSMSPGEWEDAVVYPFGLNQLSVQDLRMPGSADLDADWRLLYAGNTLYGAVQRQDDVTYTDQTSSYRNDCLEILFKIQEDFTQLRSVVGQDWERHDYPGARQAVWSSNGEVLEFSVVLPPPDLEGKIFGWLIALTDNDGTTERESQIYPVNGQNAGYQGQDYAEVEFVKSGTPGERMGMAHLPLPFRGASAINLPVIDGKEDGAEWKRGSLYPFAFNQLDSKNLTPPPAEELSGSFKFMYRGNTIYGILHRSDDITYTAAPEARENDAVEITFDFGGELINLVTVVGRDFTGAAFQGARQAVWSEGGDLLEFYLEVPVESLRGVIAGFNLALSDNDGSDAAAYRLYPVPGTDKTPSGQELGEIGFD